MAQSAFGAFIKSYATHAHGTKHIFHPKALHFGHVAKSFGLAMPPAAFRKVQREEKNSQHPKDRSKNTTGKTLSNPYNKAMVDEFGSGL
jgi:ATP-dependent RNA helicase DDX31/DBP7